MMKSFRQPPVLSLLTRYVRVITAEQCARLAFGHTKNPVTIAKQWLRRQEQAGLVTLRSVATHPELLLSGPLLEYRPGDPLPQFDALAWKAQTRWREPPQMTLLAMASEKARLQEGGTVGGRPLRNREITHDIHVTGVYLRLSETDPSIADSWIPEDVLWANGTHAGGVPDGLVLGDTPIRVEFIGRYSSAKLRALHYDYAARGRYQLW